MRDVAVHTMWRRQPSRSRGGFIQFSTELTSGGCGRTVGPLGSHLAEATVTLIARFWDFPAKHESVNRWDRATVNADAVRHALAVALGR